ncbi:hypothetical protein [Vibrio scophthalmi]|uniref:Uncharacterized protein n=1 Tax=Vibrio scophthalmi TaxID=45658 RepID=A0A1E3WMG2_9VIBR|nr:hypothetical protein [Vibrio scophthalmi]ODS10971.1 hypothetical protein VSF3289_01232 [Vibrio scophthalmi]
MNFISLQLDDNAKSIVSDFIDGLNEQDGWIQMTARIAAQIDTELRDNAYIGRVMWFSESDFIEQVIEYKG